MHTENGKFQEGDVLTLRLLEGVSDSELIQLLKTNGIEIAVAQIKLGYAHLSVRAPKRVLIVHEGND